MTDDLDQQKKSFLEDNPSLFVESIRAKNFQFSNLGYKSLNLFSYTNAENKSWKPVLTCKKLYSQPKFIMSLERKKARIISGIRDRQVQPQQQKLLGLVGSKLRNFKKPQKRNSMNISEESQRFIKANDESCLKNELKRKKNPNMNFSLMYISERKKNIKQEAKNRDKSQISRVLTSSFRQKGSDYPYIHMFMNQPSIKKPRPRPRTSCYSQRYHKLEQTKSQML